MNTYYDEENNIIDVNFSNDVCIFCPLYNKCPLIDAIQSEMVELKTTQPMEYCQIFDLFRFFAWLKELFNRKNKEVFFE